MAHESVLLHSSIEGLSIREGDTFVDATVNGGGHSEFVAQQFGNTVTIIGIDLDEDALARAETRLKKAGAKATLVQSNFRHLDSVLDKLGIPFADRILFDLGWSTDQIDSGRGFSFRKDEPLSMTFKKKPSKEEFTARDIVNDWDEENIAQIIKSYGEERYARRIAKAIVEARKIQPIEKTGELVDVIAGAVPAVYRRGKIHFATRTFQALRITVNDEIGSLREGLLKAFDRLRPDGRLAVITFHSIEDRIVKHFMKDIAQERGARVITKKPILPTEEELLHNRRARSAKLRILQK